MDRVENLDKARIMDKVEDLDKLMTCHGQVGGSVNADMVKDKNRLEDLYF
jgi:hypothetical protein